MSISSWSCRDTDRSALLVLIIDVVLTRGESWDVSIKPQDPLPGARFRLS